MKLVLLLLIFKERQSIILWGSGKIPEEVTGEVLVTDIYGKETRTNSLAVNLTEGPIFVEEHPH